MLSLLHDIPASAAASATWAAAVTAPSLPDPSRVKSSSSSVCWSNWLTMGASAYPSMGPSPPAALSKLTVSE